MRRWLLALALFAVPVTASAQSVQLDDLLTSIARHHPRVERDLARTASASGELEAARGAFDPRATLRGTSYPTGYYQSERLELGVEALTPFYGLTVLGGYRLTRGYLPIYDGRAETLDRGEVRLGLRMPLLADLRIDAARAGRSRAELDVTVAETQVRATVLELARLGAAAYYRWVAAGLSLDVNDRMLELAERRNAQLSRLAAVGSIAPIEARENERALYQRRARRTVAEQRLGQAAVQLSLYLRDRQGAPRVAGRDALPQLGEPDRTEPPSLEELVARAIDLRPDLGILRLQIDRADIAAELARNARLPRLDAQVAVSQDVGSGSADQRTRLADPVVEASLTLAAPIPNRPGTGRAAARLADVQALDAELGFALEQTAVQVQDARLAVVYAAQAVEQEHQAYLVADELARAEWRRFEEGSTTLLMVNLREQTAAEAELAWIERRLELALARALLDLALGRIPGP